VSAQRHRQSLNHVYPANAAILASYSCLNHVRFGCSCVGDAPARHRLGLPVLWEDTTAVSVLAIHGAE
jgi:hypothetical protein